jgi:hypothetical protein
MGAGIAQSVQSLPLGWTAEGIEFAEGKILLFFTSSRLVLGPIQPPIQ